MRRRQYLPTIPRFPLYAGFDHIKVICTTLAGGTVSLQGLPTSISVVSETLFKKGGLAPRHHLLSWLIHVTLQYWHPKKYILTIPPSLCCSTYWLNDALDNEFCANFIPPSIQHTSTYFRYTHGKCLKNL